jgi:UDP-2,4-diacetamido-2,4,6-trideoxy-beta-L-altropyranose hydrolase
MYFIIRADSSLTIGSGHIIRCLTLGNHIRDLGHKVSFMCRELSGNIIKIIEENNFKVIKLETEGEIIEVQTILSEEMPDWVIVDHYDLGIEWEKAVLSQNTKLFVIDDLFRNHQCSALLDQNYHSVSSYKSLVPSHAKVFLGPQFALLNKNFFTVVPPKRTFEKVKNILVCFGGTDPTEETLKILSGFNAMPENVNYHIVIGITNPKISDIKSLASEHKNIQLYIQTQEMPKLMQTCDLFLGAGGTITWERCYMGLPAICVAVAPNQESIAADLHQNLIHWYLGRAANVTTEMYASSLKSLIEDESKLIEFSQNSLALNVGSKLNTILDFFIPS